MLFKRELKVNFKSFLIWALIIILFNVIIFSIYPSMMEDTKAIEDLMSTMPERVLQAFNMDKINITTALGWYATEGYLFVCLLGGVFASNLGGSILSKEETDKTVEYLLSKPISRRKMITTKLLASMLYIVLFNLALALAILISLSIVDTIPLHTWALISMGSFLINITFFSISLVLSVFMKKTSKITQLGIGIVLGTYVLKMLSGLSDKLTFLKYFSPHEYVSSEYIMIENKLPIQYIIVMLVITVLCIVTTYQKYEKKDLA